MIPVVHILRHGLALCERVNKLGVPHDWPKGHKWVELHESDQATCKECLAVKRTLGRVLGSKKR